jgi:hypothetical protein
MTVVVDTNVILTANRQHAGVSETCIVSCAQRLQAIMTGGRVVIDDEYRILKEYQNRTTPHVGKRAGDAFVKWLLRNNANPARCDRVKLLEHQERGFESFPEDDRLETFDPADRKFVAVACAHADHPPIAQATDSKWIDWAPALRHHGVNVEFLCAKDIHRFDDKKKGRKGKPR